MASYHFSKEVKLLLILLFSLVIYLLLGEFSQYEEDTINTDIPLEKLCENIY